MKNSERSLLHAIYLGGTFDIFHNGHVELIKSFINHPKYNFISIGVSKTIKPLGAFTNFLFREKIIKSFIEEAQLENIEVRTEIGNIDKPKDQPVYTYEVLEELQHSFDKISIAVGTDQANNYQNWKNTHIIDSIVEDKLCILRGDIPCENDTFINIISKNLTHSTSAIKKELMKFDDPFGNENEIHNIIAANLSYPKTAKMISNHILDNWIRSIALHLKLKGG